MLSEQHIPFLMGLFNLISSRVGSISFYIFLKYIKGNYLNYVTLSPSRSVRCETNKPPAMRVRDEGYTQKNSKRDTIKVFKPIV